MHKKYQEKWENAYLRVKNARASTQLHFASSAKSREKFSAPPWPDHGSATVFSQNVHSSLMIILSNNVYKLFVSICVYFF